MSNEFKENCIFCKIIRGIETDANILHQDDDIMIITDKYPLAKHHILVMPKKHIENAKCLKPEDAELVEKMNNAGLVKMRELNADMNDLRSGINWPPLNTVGHLHQHFISPGASLSFLRSFFFSQRNSFFVSADYLLKRLRK